MNEFGLATESETIPIEIVTPFSFICDGFIFEMDRKTSVVSAMGRDGSITMKSRPWSIQLEEELQKKQKEEKGVAAKED